MNQDVDGAPEALPIERRTLGEFSYLYRPAKGEAVARIHFAHATGFHAGVYRAMIERLDPRIEVFALDQRGHGQTRAEANPKRLRSWKIYIDDLTTFLEQIGGDFFLGGHSMGGVVSMGAEARLVGSPKARVKGLLLVEPVAPSLPMRVMLPPLQPLGVGFLIPLAQSAKKRREHFPSRDAVYDSWSKKPLFDKWAPGTLEAYIRDGFIDTDDGQVRLACAPLWESHTFAYSEARYIRHLKKGKSPIALLRGGEGSTCSSSARNDIVRLRQVAYEFFDEKANHFIPMERPELLAEAFHALIQSTEASDLSLKSPALRANR